MQCTFNTFSAGVHYSGLAFRVTLREEWRNLQWNPTRRNASRIHFTTGRRASSHWHA